MECFAAYAAHELRGEITLQLALASIALEEPSADTIDLRQMAESVVDSCMRQERLLEALLTLAQGEYGELKREPVDLAATAADVLRGYDQNPLRRVVTLRPAVTAGHPQLVERLAVNLVENAILHNIPNGRLELATHTTSDRAVLTIANTGPAIPADEVARLFRPFQRLRSRPGRAADGVGLGLAIVQAIADAHDATVHAEPRTGGGLRIDIGFPRLPLRPTAVEARCEPQPSTNQPSARPAPADSSTATTVPERAVIQRGYMVAEHVLYRRLGDR